MKPRQLRWGLLSTALINRALIRPIQSSRRSRVGAVASRSPEQASAYAREWGIERYHGSYQALIDDPDIDIIYNPLPNHLHAEWTILAAQAGKHVLCEKPVALSVDEVQAMQRAAQENGVVVAEAFMYRSHPQTLKVKELVDSGAIGDLHLVRGSFSFTLDRPGNYRFDPVYGGGSLWDVGCYPVSYARYIVGAEPQQVFGWQVPGPGGADDFFAGQMRFPNGVLAQFDCSFRSAYRTSMELLGSDGIIRLEHPFRPAEREKIELVKNGRTDRLPVRASEAYTCELHDMEDAVLEGKPQRVSLDDSRGNVAAILALLRSSLEGQPVLL